MNETFTCANCGETFPKAWSTEEAEAEMRDLWGDLPPEDRAVLCDVCFEDFMVFVREVGLL